MSVPAWISRPCPDGDESMSEIKKDINVFIKPPAKVLVFGMTENPGGVESFLMDYYRRIDREKIQFSFW